MENYLILKRDGVTKFCPYEYMHQEVDVLGFCSNDNVDITNPKAIPKIQIRTWVRRKNIWQGVRLIADQNGVEIKRGYTLKLEINNTSQNWNVDNIILSEKDRNSIEEVASYYMTNCSL